MTIYTDNYTASFYIKRTRGYHLSGSLFLCL